MPVGKVLAADTVKLTVKNKSGSVFVIRLSGPESYTNTVKKGTSKFDVVPGIYRYSYTACGTTQTTGTINATKNAVLVVAKCPPGLPPLVTFTLKNKTGEYLQLILTGRQTYNFKPGAWRPQAHGIRGQVQICRKRLRRKISQGQNEYQERV